jgi:phosphoribosylglycinamide formyltransferase-1
LSTEKREPLDPLRVGVLISGRGSNLQALIDASRAGWLHAQIAVVISNHADAPGVQRAQQAGIPTYALERKSYPTREAHHLAMLECLKQHQVGLVVCAGFDRILVPAFVEAFPHRIINIHPSLLPAFAGGMAPKPQQDALAAGVKIAGCSVHIVTNELDAGPIVGQAAVPVLPDDTVERLSARILEQEHRLLPLVVQWFAEGRVQVEGNIARVEGVVPALFWHGQQGSTVQ